MTAYSTYISASSEQVVNKPSNNANPPSTITVLIRGERDDGHGGGPSVADYAALSALLWPLAVIFVAWLFRREVSVLLGRIKEVSFQVLGQKISISSDKASDVLEEMAGEMRSDLREVHWKLFHQIRRSDGSERVDDIFPGFKRDTPEHKLLGELRGRNLIRPLEGGAWRDFKHPVLTRLAAAIARVKPDFFPTA